MKTQSLSRWITRTRLRLLAGMGALALLLLVGMGCDAIVASEDVGADAAEEAITLDALITSTASPLGLSGPQSERLGDVARRFRGQPPQPGVLWTVAAEIHPELTSEQVDMLEARLRTIAERLADRRDDGRRNGPPNGSGRGAPGMGQEGPNGPRGPDAGLDLTDEQREALREIRGAYRTEYRTLIAAYEAGDVSEAQVATAYIELAAALREEARAVFTEEQRAQIAERRADGDQRRQELQAASNEALGLTDLQADGFGAMRQLEMGLHRGILLVHHFDAWLTAREALLTDVQTEITIVHAALVVEHRCRMMQERRGPGEGPGGRGPGGSGG